jgi:hypothetical protein
MPPLLPACQARPFSEAPRRFPGQVLSPASDRRPVQAPAADGGAGSSQGEAKTRLLAFCLTGPPAAGRQNRSWHTFKRKHARLAWNGLIRPAGTCSGAVSPLPVHGPFPLKPTPLPRRLGKRAKGQGKSKNPAKLTAAGPRATPGPLGPQASPGARARPPVSARAPVFTRSELGRLLSRGRLQAVPFAANVGRAPTSAASAGKAPGFPGNAGRAPREVLSGPPAGPAAGTRLFPACPGQAATPGKT